jgi:hypothetical protein
LFKLHAFWTWSLEEVTGQASEHRGKNKPGWLDRRLSGHQSRSGCHSKGNNRCPYCKSNLGRPTRNLPFYWLSCRDSVNVEGIRFRCKLLLTCRPIFRRVQTAADMPRGDCAVLRKPSCNVQYKCEIWRVRSE